MTPLTRFGLQIPSFTYEGVDDSHQFDCVAGIAVDGRSSFVHPHKPLLPGCR